MGFFTIHNKFKESVRQHNATASAYSQPLARTTSEPCHCVGDEELDYRYNMLRVEEHARVDGLCGDEWSKSVSKLPENVERNRYVNISPWNHSRVKLPVRQGANDYINASWIQMGSKTYIASQGPLLNTTEHFWQMAYAYGGKPIVIVMLTALHENSVEKCCKYWPDSKTDSMSFPNTSGDFMFGLTVSFEKATQNDHYNYSQFKLTPDNPEYPAHVVHHIYYHSWSDFKKPNFDADLRSLIYFLNNKLKNPGAPPIVHCSAGIGRTGTFIALDSLLSKIDVEIELSLAPVTSPVWELDISEILHKATPFTGPRDHHMNLETGSIISTSLISETASLHSPLTPTTNSLIAIDKVVPKSTPRVSALSTALRLPLSQSTTPMTLSPSATGVDPNAPQSYPEQDSITQAPGVLPQESYEKAATGIPAVDTTGIPAADTTGPMESDTGDANESPQPTFDLTLVSPSQCECPSTVLPEPKLVPAVDAKTGPAPSAKTGPILTKKASSYKPSEEFYDQRLEKVDVIGWYEQGPDVVLSAVRCMRLQRPKMVQGTSQLGYIYDQYEVGMQLARACGSLPDKDKERAPRRSNTETFTGSFNSANAARSGFMPSSASSERMSGVSHRSGRRPQRSNTLSSIQNFFTSNPSPRNRAPATAGVPENNQGAVKRQSSVRS